jgi:prolyl-tRNA editing enzyme YbaK/EbsC (Cys-tRNA(Pro) deacylase)
MSQLRTPADLAQYITEREIVAELVHPPHETPTVPQAARAMACREDQIVKSVLFMIKDGQEYDVALIIANGTAQIDSRKLATLFGVGRKRIKLAPPGVVMALTGYPAGGVPPFGFPDPIDTFIDHHVFQETVIYAGGGDELTLLRISPEELGRVTAGRTVDVRATPAG